MPIDKNVQLGKEVRIFHPDLVNLYGCVIGDENGSELSLKFRSVPRSGREARQGLVSGLFFFQGLGDWKERRTRWIIAVHLALFAMRHWPTLQRVLVLGWWLRDSLQIGQVIPLFYRDCDLGAILRLILPQKDIFGSKVKGFW
jgi:hypothetical protein